MGRRVALLLVTVQLCGCQYFRERSAIEQYSNDLAAANGLVAQINQLEKSGELEKQLAIGIKPFQAYLDQRLLPLWKRYVDALKAVNCKTKALAAIHATIVSAEEKVYQSLLGLRSNLTLETLKAQLAAHRVVVQQAEAERKKYLSALDAHYTKHNYVPKR